ncbi:enoyl-CoA hydratase [Pikeienuella piscinae]|uniref:Enoyl-CoA hydratase n=1 Tax=Pikeienuella piscinae TaxID=2748098 RepID=A0A7L5BZ55_9RHOB|nr:enoyl-CoA hydratase family protein [Pikeienuella piscinae]QIE56383.1 enoyl-CoA hydratase [Pikeienuella piscinae]
MSRVPTHREGRVLHIVNNAPEQRNAFGLDFYDGMIPAIESASSDDVGAVVISGAGGFFCAGGDVRRLAVAHKEPYAARRHGVDRLHEMIRAIRACPRPVIAAVEGGAVGAGASLAAACDLIVASKDAYFMLAYVKIGITPDGGATWSFARALPRQFATEMALTGGRVAAARLHQLGMVNRLADDPLAEALIWAGELAAGPPDAMTGIKRMIGAAEEAAFEAQLEMEADGIANALAGSEGIEGATAFVEKREARFHRK